MQEDFTNYLEHTGLSKVLRGFLLQLFDRHPWPEDSVDAFRLYLKCPLDLNYDKLRAENEELRLRNEELEATIDSLIHQLETGRGGILERN